MGHHLPLAGHGDANHACWAPQMGHRERDLRRDICITTDRKKNLAVFSHALPSDRSFLAGSEGSIKSENSIFDEPSVSPVTDGRTEQVVVPLHPIYSK